MSNIDQLAAILTKAKEAEESARNERIKAEESLIALLGCKSEGSQTTKGEFYKVTVTGKINRILDVAAWDSVKAHVPEKFHPIKYKPEIDIKGLKWLAEHEQGIYATVCQAISAKPGKPSVTLEWIG